MLSLLRLNSAFKLQLRKHPIKRFQSTKTPEPGTLAQKTKQYGMLSVLVYSSLSFTTFCGCIFAISRLDLTTRDLTNVLNKVRVAIGIDPVVYEEEPEQKDQSKIYTMLPEWAKTERVRKGATNVLLAMAMTKLFAPVKIGLTAMIVPSLARKLRTMGLLKSFK